MSFNLRATAFLFVLIVLVSVQAYPQSVRGKVIYVSPVQDVKLKFRSAVSNYSFVNKSQAAAFKIKQSGKSLHINNVLENFKPANLVITEGQNTHLFILAYKSGLDASNEIVYDFSSKEKVEQQTQKVTIVTKTGAPPVQTVQVKNSAASEEKTMVTQAVVTTPATGQTANKNGPVQIMSDVPARPQATASADPQNNKHITSISTAPAKTKVVSVAVPTYSSEIAKGTIAFKEKNYKAAKSYFQSAQQLNPTAKYPKMRLAEIDRLMKRKRK